MESGDSVVGIGDYDVELKSEKLKSVLSHLLADPILADVPRNPTLSDVVTLVSLEKGSAMRLSIIKLDGSSLGIYIYIYFIWAFCRTSGVHYRNTWVFLFSHLCFLLIDVAVMSSATLKDLKLLIKKKVNEMEQANMGHRHISWYSFSRPFLLILV